MIKKRILCLYIIFCMVLGITTVPLAATEEEITTAKYAIVAKIDDYDVTLVLADGTNKTYEVKDTDVYMNAKTTAGVAGLWAVDTIRYVNSYIVATADQHQYAEAHDCVVEYSLQSGRITSLVYQTPTYIDTNIWTKGEYRAEVSRIGSIGVNSSTNIVDVDWASYRDYKRMDVDQLADGEKYAGAGFGKITGTSIYSFVILTNAGYLFNSKSRFAVLDTNAWTVGLDADGDTVDQLKVVVDGKKTTLNVSAAYRSANWTLGGSRGDAFFYTIDDDGLVDSIRWIPKSTITDGTVTLANAFGWNYDTSTWGSSLYNTNYYKNNLVKGIIVGVDSNTVKMIDVPTVTDGPVDISNYEAFRLADDCLIYTYNTAPDIEDRLKAQGTLVASDFSDWKITETPGYNVGTTAIAAATGYSISNIGWTAWTTTSVPTTTEENPTFWAGSANEWAAERGIKQSKVSSIKGKNTNSKAEYAMALVIDDQVVEIYEIMEDPSESGITYSNAESVEVPADTFESVSSWDNSIKFGSIKYLLDSSVNIYINGHFYDTIQPYYSAYTIGNVMQVVRGNVRLNKTGSATKYNEIYVEAYDIGQVSSVNYRDGFTTVKFNSSMSNLSSYDQITVSDSDPDFTVSLDGNPIQLKELKPNDVIAIKTKIVNNYPTLYSGNDYDTEILATRNVISGKVTAIDIEDNSFTVDGNDYAAVDKYDLGFCMGTVYNKIFLDPFGRIFSYDDTEVLEIHNYAIVAKIDDYDVTLVLADGTKKTYEVKDTDVYRNAKTTAGVSGLWANETIKDVKTTVVATANKHPNAEVQDCVVEYTLKSSKITSLVYQTPTYISINAYTKEEYRAEVSRIGSIGVNSNTQIIDVDKISYRQYSGMSVSQLLDGEKYAGAAYGKITGTSVYSFVILTNAGFAFNSRSRFAVLDTNDWSQGLDEDGDTVDQLKVVIDGKKTTLDVATSYKSSNPTLGGSRGDAFFYTVDDDGLVDSIRWIPKATIRGGTVTLANAFGPAGLYYDNSPTKWDIGSSLPSYTGTASYRLIQGIVVGVDSDTVKMIDIPTTADGPVDISNYEAFRLADDCLIYTYNTVVDVEDQYRLNPQGKLFTSYFNDWEITTVPDGSLSNYTANDIGKIVWRENAVPDHSIAWAKARGMNEWATDALSGEKTADYAYYAMALVIDDQIVEIYEIGDVDLYNPVLYGDVDGDGIATPSDTVFLARHLAGWKGFSEINTVTSDVNCDGKVNALDNIILARHLAGWKGYETLPYMK
ncbi:MAG: dockerin type I repeat-containing protein [Clostridia bacterium]|nr:dockerin type I repeat-containing protein [Clostridia bacterium]